MHYSPSPQKSPHLTSHFSSSLPKLPKNYQKSYLNLKRKQDSSAFSSILGNHSVRVKDHNTSTDFWKNSSLNSSKAYLFKGKKNKSYDYAAFSYDFSKNEVENSEELQLDNDPANIVYQMDHWLSKKKSGIKILNRNFTEKEKAKQISKSG